MFFHEFRADFVLAWELLLQGGDPQILRVGGPSGAGLEGGGAVLEELLLPAVEHRGVAAVLVTQIRDGDVLEEMESQDGDLLLGGEPLAGLLGHGRTSARDCSLSERVIIPIPFEAGHVELHLGTSNGISNRLLLPFNDSLVTTTTITDSKLDNSGSGKPATWTRQVETKVITGPRPKCDLEKPDTSKS